MVGIQQVWHRNPAPNGLSCRLLVFDGLIGVEKGNFNVLDQNSDHRQHNKSSPILAHLHLKLCIARFIWLKPCAIELNIHVIHTLSRSPLSLYQRLHLLLLVLTAF